MRPDPYGTTPMFTNIPASPVAPFNDVSSGTGRAIYTRYAVKKSVKCDDCMAAYQANPQAPHSRTAAYRRTQRDARPLLLCYEHVSLRKEAEAS